MAERKEMTIEKVESHNTGFIQFHLFPIIGGGSTFIDSAVWCRLIEMEEKMKRDGASTHFFRGLSIL